MPGSDIVLGIRKLLLADPNRQLQVVQDSQGGLQGYGCRARAVFYLCALIRRGPVLSFQHGKFPTLFKNIIS